ncbi:hypothetical protein SAMN04515691_2770 [Leifsonia sp. 98AMF]|uniref:hypothetical protein n=1 Tax=unclassified Leifsonia TaxID=2663824 RepID=UPI00087ADC0C|nr:MULTISPECIES: hypothetical protein [unclassified Leifsonia]SDH20736.1 hypothetical protein SAMN04515690_1246 [Leifsonia sp. 197AMF]SDJ17901.1 hypothetical protein SAMN04515684_2536 [Leifsonia sp. 466MF]SDJ48983.1 hypothetical protein SAMN04515683_0207 [Leifsonia sp. 157MF]SDN39199.1 hypothetical protein SAMN04515686_0720 [Leifsonia sp. 509MF]SEM81713.1 hypothetical protein SAMN04515685_0195 [Leifsonia sp. 467MF]
MPLLEDLTVYEDGDRYDVYDHSFPDEDAELGRGRLLGAVTVTPEGEYIPSGEGARYEYIAPARTLDEALGAFVGSA